LIHLVAIAWLYVTLLMALAEATAANGSLLGACITFIFYGVLPLAVLLYILGTPARRRMRRMQQHQSNQQPDAGGHAPTAALTDTVTPVREEE